MNGTNTSMVTKTRLPTFQNGGNPSPSRLLPICNPPLLLSDLKPLHLQPTRDTGHCFLLYKLKGGDSHKLDFHPILNPKPQGSQLLPTPSDSSVYSTHALLFWLWRSCTSLRSKTILKVRMWLRERNIFLALFLLPYYHLNPIYHTGVCRWEN